MKSFRSHFISIQQWIPDRSRSKFPLILIFLFIYLANTLFAQNYLWPTNASQYLTSSFCEYRPNHYHSAIDIKTWNKEGYPCYAIEDGEIYKIRVSPFGYGKVIYLKLKDGNYAIYAHLQKFTSEIDAQIREKQLANKKYRLNWSPQNRRVKKGDIIGYTGSTGIGTPHLHFEIRNSKEQPLNPLAFYTQVKDNIRPKLQKMAVIPLKSNSVVNKSFSAQQFNLTHIKDGIYVIKEPIYAQGKIGLAIKGYDLADGVYNKFAFYQTSMEINGTEVFSIIYDKMDFATTEYIDTEIYYPFRAKDKDVFHKLYIEPFNKLPFYKPIPNTDGTINIRQNIVSFTVTVQDFSGNTSKIIGEILPDYEQEIQIEQKTKISDWVYLKFNIGSFNFLSFSTSQNLEKWNDVSYFEITDRKFNHPLSTLTTKIRLPDSLDQFIKIKTKSYDNKTIQKVVNLSASEDSIINPKLIISGKKLIIESNRVGPVFFTINNNQIHELSAVQAMDGKTQCAIPIKQFAAQDFKIGYKSNDSKNWLEDPGFVLFPSGEEVSAAWYDNTVEITANPSSFFDSTLIQVKKSSLDSNDFDIPTGKFVYEISPVDVALLNGVTVFIQPDSISDSNKWGIYKLNGEQKLSFVSSHFDSLKNGFLFRTKSLGRFIAARDTLLPVLEITSPAENKIYSKNPMVRFKADDYHSGIDLEENISVTVDNMFVLPEWDPEEKTVFALIDPTLSPGKHVLTIEVKDNVGNTTNKSIEFQVK